METEKQLTQVYDDFVVKHRAAYAGFKTIYEDKNPLPILAKADHSDWYIALGVTVIVIASIVVSGSRTITEFGGGLVGVAAFVMLECAVVAYAFIYTKNNINDERIDDVRKLTKRGMWLALIVAVVANVHATLKQNGVISSDTINIIILLMVGISAPLLAYISGDIAGLEYMRAMNRARRIDEQNRQLMSEWQDGLNRAWAAQQSKWGVKIEVVTEQKAVQSPSAVHSLNSLNEVNERGENSYSANSSTGYTKRMDARSLVHEFFTEHPDKLNAKLDELVVQIEQEKGVKVGRTSIHNVRRDIVQNGGQS